MEFCKIWNAGAVWTLRRWETNTQVCRMEARGMKALIECRMAGCGWVGECGPVAKCGRCGSSYIRIAGVRIESGQGVAS